MAYTKGKWIKAGLLVTSGQNIIADCRQEQNLNEMDSNAQLIAAAPDMYEALLRAYSHLCNGEFNNSEYVQNIKIQVEKALLKVEGK